MSLTFRAGGISQGFMMTSRFGLAQTASMFRQARDLVAEEPKPKETGI